jgi:hypothetical protein
MQDVGSSGAHTWEGGGGSAYQNGCIETLCPTVSHT